MCPAPSASATRRRGGSRAGRRWLRHVTDNARIVPVVARQPRISGVAVGDPASCHGFTFLARTNALDRLAELLVGDSHGQAQPTRTGVEILCALAPLRPAGTAVDHLDGADDQDFAGGAGLEGRVAGAEDVLESVSFEFSTSTTPREDRGRDRIERRSFCASSQAVLGDAEGPPIVAPNAVECVAIRCAAQNHVVSGNFDRCIAVPAVSEVCRPQSRHSNRRGRLFKATARPPPQAGQTNPSRQRRADRNASQRASSGNSRWNSASVRPRPTAPRSEPALASSAPSFRHYI